MHQVHVALSSHSHPTPPSPHIPPLACARTISLRFDPFALQRSTLMPVSCLKIVNSSRFGFDPQELECGHAALACCPESACLNDLCVTGSRAEACYVTYPSSVHEVSLSSQAVMCGENRSLRASIRQAGDEVEVKSCIPAVRHRRGRYSVHLGAKPRLPGSRCQGRVSCRASTHCTRISQTAAGKPQAVSATS